MDEINFMYMNFDNLDQIQLPNWIDHNGSTRKLLMRSMEPITWIMFMAFVTWMTNSFMNENHINWTSWQMDEEKYYHIDEIDEMRKFDNMDENECFP
jgi:hypothetical protein